jgi:hypothetical protein
MTFTRWPFRRFTQRGDCVGRSIASTTSEAITTKVDRSRTPQKPVGEQPCRSRKKISRRCGFCETGDDRLLPRQIISLPQMIRELFG